MSRDYLLFLEDMQTSCEKILRYTEDIDLKGSLQTKELTKELTMQ